MNLVMTILLCLFPFMGVGCKGLGGTGARLDRDALQSELKALDQDATEFIAMLGPEDETLRDTVAKVQKALAVVSEVLAAGGEELSLVEALDAALAVAPDAATIFDPDPAKQERVRLYAFGARALLRHWRTLAQ